MTDEQFRDFVVELIILATPEQMKQACERAGVDAEAQARRARKQWEQLCEEVFLA